MAPPGPLGLLALTQGTGAPPPQPCTEVLSGGLSPGSELRAGAP